MLFALLRAESAGVLGALREFDPTGRTAEADETAAAEEEEGLSLFRLALRWTACAPEAAVAVERAASTGRRDAPALPFLESDAVAGVEEGDDPGWPLRVGAGVCRDAVRCEPNSDSTCSFELSSTWWRDSSGYASSSASSYARREWPEECGFNATASSYSSSSSAVASYARASKAPWVP
jgi:hypothetical protein